MGKIKNTVANILTYPKRHRVTRQIARDTQLVKDFKMVREAKGAEPIPNDHRSPLFRARANVLNYKTKKGVK